MNWPDLDRAKREPEAMGKWRKLMGSGYNHSTNNPQYDLDNDDYAAGGRFTMKELAIQKGDKVKLVYDLGDRNEFLILVEEVKTNQPLLPEVSLKGQDTRAKLIEKSAATIHNQHGRSNRYF